MIRLVLNPGIVGEIVRSELTVLDQRSHACISKIFTESLIVVALVSGQTLQIFGVPLGDLRADPLAAAPLY
jgi:hypothetical protein